MIKNFKRRIIMKKFKRLICILAAAVMLVTTLSFSTGCKKEKIDADFQIKLDNQILIKNDLAHSSPVTVPYDGNRHYLYVYLLYKGKIVSAEPCYFLKVSVTGFLPEGDSESVLEPKDFEDKDILICEKGRYFCLAIYVRNSIADNFKLDERFYDTETSFILIIE